MRSSKLQKLKEKYSLDLSCILNTEETVAAFKGTKWEANNRREARRQFNTNVAQECHWTIFLLLLSHGKANDKWLPEATVVAKPKLLTNSDFSLTG